MHRLYTALTLLPAPLFFLGFIYSVTNMGHVSICGSHPWEMPVMWSVMTLAHLVPWFLFWQQKIQT